MKSIHLHSFGPFLSLVAQLRLPIATIPRIYWLILSWWLVVWVEGLPIPFPIAIAIQWFHIQLLRQKLVLKCCHLSRLIRKIRINIIRTNIMITKHTTTCGTAKLRHLSHFHLLNGWRVHRKRWKWQTLLLPLKFNWRLFNSCHGTLAQIIYRWPNKIIVFILAASRNYTWIHLKCVDVIIISAIHLQRFLLLISF